MADRDILYEIDPVKGLIADAIAGNSQSILDTLSREDALFAGAIRAAVQTVINERLGAQTVAQIQTVADAVTNAVTTFLTQGHSTSGAAAAGFGIRHLFQLEDAGGNAVENAAAIDVIWSDATADSEDAAILFMLKAAGAAIAEKVRIASDGSIGVGVTPSSLLDLQKAGTAKANLDLLELTNSGNAADMDVTETSILFNQFYYDATTPAVADAARIVVGTEQDWTSTAATQDSYMALHTALNGTVAEKLRLDSVGNLLFLTTVAIQSPNTDDTYITFKARDNGVGLVEIARLAGSADPALEISDRLNFRDAGGATVLGGQIRVVKVSKAYNADLFDAAALTDSATVWTQPADSVLLGAKMVLATQFAAASMTDLDVTIGLAGDNDGLTVQAMNLTSDAGASEYKDRGAYWSAVTAAGYYSAADVAWIAYTTAVGANLSTLTAGQLDFYFIYLQL